MQQRRNEKTDSYLLHLAHSRPAGELADALQDEAESMVRAGTPRRAVYEDLGRLALTLREEDSEDLEDDVLEVMDALSGWCAPSARI